MSVARGAEGCHSLCSQLWRRHDARFRRTSARRDQHDAPPQSGPEMHRRPTRSSGRRPSLAYDSVKRVLTRGRGFELCQRSDVRLCASAQENRGWHRIAHTPTIGACQTSRADLGKCFSAGPRTTRSGVATAAGEHWTRRMLFATFLAKKCRGFTCRVSTMEAKCTRL